MLLDFCSYSWFSSGSEFLCCFFGIEVAMSGMLKLCWSLQPSYPYLVEPTVWGSPKMTVEPSSSNLLESE